MRAILCSISPRLLSPASFPTTRPDVPHARGMPPAVRLSTRRAHVDHADVHVEEVSPYALDRHLRLPSMRHASDTWAASKTCLVVASFGGGTTGADNAELVVVRAFKVHAPDGVLRFKGGVAVGERAM